MLRFAPSPTHDMNIDDLRIAIYNYIVSKQLKEDLTIRIEDIEKEKNIDGKDKEILEILSLFSIDYISVVHQSDSLKYHQKMAMQLLTQKKAFSCFCGDTKLQELKDEAKAANKPYSYDGFCETLSDETILEVNSPFTVRIKNKDDAFIILNHDKTPTYNYACAVDDMLMDISIVIRDEKHLLDTTKQIHVRDSLNYTKEIKYVHLPSISNIQDNHNSVKSLIDEGFLPSAIANYLVLLGNETKKEIFTLEEAIEWFDIDNLSSTPASFDIDKLMFLNRKHLEIMDEMRLSKILGFSDLDIGKLAKVYLNDFSTIKELKNKIDLIFTSKTTCEGFETEFTQIKKCLQKAPFFAKFDDLEEYLIKNTKLKGESLSKPLTYILTASNSSVDIALIYPFIKNYLGEITR